MTSVINSSTKTGSVVSYSLLTGRYAMSTEQLRIVLSLVRFLQCVFRGKDLGKMMQWQKETETLPDRQKRERNEEFLAYVREALQEVGIAGVSMELSSGGFLYVKAPYKEFAAPNAKHYDRLKDALRTLASARIEVETERMWTNFAVVESPVIERYQSVELSVGRYMFLQLLNLASGFRMVDMDVVFRLKSMYSIRLLLLLSGQKKPVVMSVRSLREMFDLNDKYERDSDFIERTVGMAKKELDAKSAQSFTFMLEYDPMNSRKVRNIRFLPCTNLIKTA